MIRKPKLAPNKLVSMKEAIADTVKPGCNLYIEGFTHLISFAAAHEIIRQEIKDLTAIRLTPDLVYDQLIEAGLVKKLVFSWAGNPGVGSLHALRRVSQKDSTKKIELEEYSHFGMVARLLAGSSGLPFWPLKNYEGTHIAQVWGLMGTQKEAAFASKRVIVVAEEIVDTALIRRDPNRTLIPGILVDHVVHEPWGCHPSYAQGYYDRDNQFYVDWEEVSRDPASYKNYLDAFVYGVKDRKEYIAKMGTDLFTRLKAKPRKCEGVDYGY